MTSLALSDSQAAGQEAVFVLLPDESGEAAERLLQQMEQAAGKITENGTPVGTFKIDSKSDDYALLTTALFQVRLPRRDCSKPSSRQARPAPAVQRIAHCAAPSREMFSMQEWIDQTLGSPTFGLSVLLASFLLGLVGSVVSAGCSIPVFGAIVGYSGMQSGSSHRTNLFGALFFMLGSITALLILGSIAGFIGQAAQSSLGKYWKLFAGFVAIFFGLAALKVLPFKLPQKTSGSEAEPRGLFGAAMFGLVMGGGISVCSLCCNPGIFVVLGVVILQGYSLWAMTIFLAYAVGFSLPLAALMLGISFGKVALKAKKVEGVVRIAAGLLLVLAGFYFLATV
ncbi:MAG: cytochrome c biogenesis CcdA family protein [Planctomycetota bacterium]